MSGDDSYFCLPFSCDGQWRRARHGAIILAKKCFDTFTGSPSKEPYLTGFVCGSDINNKGKSVASIFLIMNKTMESILLMQIVRGDPSFPIKQFFESTTLHSNSHFGHRRRFSTFKKGFNLEFGCVRLMLKSFLRDYSRQPDKGILFSDDRIKMKNT